LCVPAAFTGRAVPSPGLPTQRLSRFGVFCPAGTHRPDVRPCGFPTPRACTSFLSRCRRRRAGHSSPVSYLGDVPGPPAGSHDLGGRVVARPPTLVGFAVPFAALILPARVRVVFPRLGPTCRLVRSSAASVLARGCRDKPSRRWGRRDVRLLGFGPAGKPFPAVHRPRYSFCAEGRRDARAVAAMGFCSSFRSSESLAAGLHLWSLSAWGFARSLSFGVVGGGRLVVPGFSRTDSLCEVFAPSARRRRLGIGCTESHRLKSSDRFLLAGATARSERVFIALDVPSFRD
jgi:hypothetical protein